MSIDSTTELDTPPDLTELEHVLNPHTALPSTTLSNVIDTIIDRLGALSSWLWIVTVVVIMWSVIARYGFNTGSVMLEEIQWHLAGAAWLIGLSYTLVHDDHVRVDIFHERFSERARAWIEFCGILFLLLPFLVITFIEILPYAMSSFEQAESSPAPNGLPARWIMKAILALSVGLLAAAALSRLTRTSAKLFGWPKRRVEQNKTT